MSKYYIGKTFTAKPANKTATPKSTTSYQWLSESLPLSGETGTTYVTSSTDVGNQLQVRQVETNRYGAASATSSNVEVFTSNYGITDTEPYLIADFLGGYYRSDYRDSTFGDAFEYSTTGLSTMMDSDGILKWAPHNFVPYSNDFTQGWTAVSGTTITTNAVSAFGLNGIKLVSDNGGTRHEINDVLPVSSVSRRLRVIAKAAEWDFLFLFHDGPNEGVYYDLTNGVVANTQGGGVGEITSLGDGWYACDLITSFWQNGRRVFIKATNVNNTTSVTGDGVSGIYILSANQWDDRLPLAANPDAPDAAIPWYVETTGTTKYLPRRNAYYYDTITSSWKNGGLLLESAAATNLLANNTDLSGWTATNATLSQTGSTAPDGSASWRITDNATNNTHRAYFANAFTVGAGFTTWSVFVKQGTARYAVFGHSTAPIVSTVNVSVIFDTQTGTFSDTGNGPNANYIDTYRASEYGNGWWRIEFSSDLASANYDNILVGVSSDGTYANLSYSGSGEYIDFWMPQIEVGSVASSPIPTTGSTVTRPAQDLNVYYNKILGIGGVAMQGSITFTDEDVASQQTFWRRYKDADEYIIAYMDTDSSTNLELNVEQSNVGSVGSVTLSTEYAPSLRTFYNFASSHGTNTINLNDGVDTGTADTTSGTLPSFTTQGLDLGHDYMGMISAVAIYENTLSDALLAESSVDFQFWLRGDNINTDGIWVDSVGWE